MKDIRDKYRNVYFPSCPYCHIKEINYSDFTDLVNMATNGCKSDVVLKCPSCGKKYRVTVTIKYNSRKMQEG